MTTGKGYASHFSFLLPSRHGTRRIDSLGVRFMTQEVSSFPAMVQGCDTGRNWQTTVAHERLVGGVRAPVPVFVFVLVLVFMFMVVFSTCAGAVCPACA